MSIQLERTDAVLVTFLVVKQAGKSEFDECTSLMLFESAQERATLGFFEESFNWPGHLIGRNRLDERLGGERSCLLEQLAPFGRDLGIIDAERGLEIREV